MNGDPSLESGNVDLFDVADQPVGSLAASSPGARLNETGAGPKPRRGRRWAPLIEPAGNFYSLVTGGGTSGHAVRLEPGTRNLVLVRPLDKESAEGEQGILVHVRCRGRARPAESSTIPVRIIVTDANDHAPEFVGAQPYVVNVSETTPIGTIVSRDILATDRDSAGPFSTLHYRVLEEPSPFQFANPLEPTLVLAGPLDYETQGPTLTLSIQVQDEGEPEPLTASAQVQVNIIGKCPSVPMTTAGSEFHLSMGQQFDPVAFLARSARLGRIIRGIGMVLLIVRANEIRSASVSSLLWLARLQLAHKVSLKMQSGSPKALIYELRVHSGRVRLA